MIERMIAALMRYSRVFKPTERWGRPLCYRVTLRVAGGRRRVFQLEGGNSSAQRRAAQVANTRVTVTIGNQLLHASATKKID